MRMHELLYIMEINGPTIINKNSDILFPSVKNTVVFMMSFAAAIISFFLLVLLLISSSSFFVLAVDMPPPSTPPPTTTEKPGTHPSTTTSTTPPPPNIPKVEEKKDPKDGDTILSSKTDDGTKTVATKVDKSSKTETFNFNRGYVLGFASALDPGLSKVFKQKLDLMGMVYNAYPEEFKNGFMLGFVSGSDYLNTFGLLGEGGSPDKK